MITTYRIEVWHTASNKYIISWSGNSFAIAEKMMFKSYYQHATRRLIKSSEEVLYTEKAKKK